MFQEIELVLSQPKKEALPTVKNLSNFELYLDQVLACVGSAWKLSGNASMIRQYMSMRVMSHDAARNCCHRIQHVLIE